MLVKCSLNDRTRAGYTLVELSIVLMILALLTTGAAALLQKKNDADKNRLTLQRMEYVEGAIKNFYEINRFLPCPAGGQFADNSANFGISGAGTGLAGNATTSAGYNPAANPPDCAEIDPGMGSAGVVPTRTLQIPDEYMYDGWNRRFTYRIASRMGRTREFADENTRGDIAVINLAGRDLTQINAPSPYNYGAAYVLISHGPNGHYAWLSTGLRYVGAAPAGGMEQENGDHQEAPLGTGDRLYVKDTRTVYFDDITHYKRKADFKPKRRGVSPYWIQGEVGTAAQTIVSRQDIIVRNNGIGIPPAVFNDNQPNSGMDTVLLEAARSIVDLYIESDQPSNNACIENLHWKSSPVQDCYCEQGGHAQLMDYDSPDGERLGGCADNTTKLPIMRDVPANTCINNAFNTAIDVRAGTKLVIEVNYFNVPRTYDTWTPLPGDDDGPSPITIVSGLGEVGETDADPTRPVATFPEGALIYCVTTDTTPPYTCTGGAWTYAGNFVVVPKQQMGVSGWLLLAPNISAAKCATSGASAADVLQVLISQ